MSRIRDSRRAEILAAARQEMLEKGLEAASVSEIARRAGVGKSTIYEYFRSKEQMLEESGYLVWEELEKRFTAVFDGERPIRAKLLDYYRVMMEMLRSVGPHFSRMLTEHSRSSLFCERVGSLRTLLGELMTRALQEAQEHGEVKKTLDIPLTADFLLTQANPFLLRSLEKSSASPEQLLDLLFGGLED